MRQRRDLACGFDGRDNKWAQNFIDETSWKKFARTTESKMDIFYLFIYDFFNCAIDIWGHVVSNVKMISEQWIWKDAD
jgi:hypothetical protein